MDPKHLSFTAPSPNSKYTKYLEQIENEIKQETPIAYGLHPNAEIDLGTNQCNYMFERLNELMPRDFVQDQGEIVSQSKNIDFYFSKIFYEMNLKDKIFNLAEIKDRIVEIGPF